MLHEIRGYFALLPAEKCPNLSAFADEVTGGELDERFQFGLGLFLDALRRRLDYDDSA